MIKRLGIKHVRCVLLYGLPGTGKTLLARQISNMLSGRKPQVVGCAEHFGRDRDEAKKMVRELFVDAEREQKRHGERSSLHVINLDEFDTIATKRAAPLTYQRYGIVNEFLRSQIYSMEFLDNVLLIGMTNRMDLIDKSLLRPGLFEIQIEIKLPDEFGCLEILQVHTSKLSQADFLSPNVSLQVIATLTKSYTGAELEGVVRRAVSFAASNQVESLDGKIEVDERNIKVTMDDFLKAVQEKTPMYGTSTFCTPG